MEIVLAAVTRRLATLLVTALALPATPSLAAGEVSLDLPAGPLGKAVTALGMQADIDIIVDDAALWRRPVPALRGRYPPAVALRRLLAKTGAAAVPVGPGSWRVRTAPARRPSVAAPHAVPATADAEMIIVTASKRDVRLSDFPGSVGMLDGAELTFGGPGGTDAVVSRFASVSSTYLGAGRNKLFIRGIADSSFTGPTQATVGQYLGDLRLTYNAPDPDLRLYDIGSVEVLEGPQGTLYGAGSMGGIIRVVPNVPELDAANGSVAMGLSATQNGEPGGDVSAVVNLPVVSDKIGLRLVGYGESDGGYIDNPLRQRKNINRTTIGGGRATLRFALGDGWTVDLGAILQRNHGDDGQYADEDKSRLTRSSPVTEGFDADYKLGEVVVAKEWDGLHFRASTGFVRQHLNERFDASPSDAQPQVFAQDNSTRMLTTEARLWRPMQDGYGWVVGASYVDNKTRLDRALGPPGATLPVTGVFNRIHEGTIYGDASVRLLPWLTATGGGRVAVARLSGGGNAVTPALSLSDALARARITGERKSTSLLPSFALAATPVDRLTLYARYQQGFRPGGLAIQSGFVERFHSDRVETVEAGARYSRPGPHSWEIAATLSGTRWKHIQADFVDGLGLPSTANIGDGRILSFAASGSWRPVPDVKLEAAVALNDSKVTKPNARYLALLSNLADSQRRIPNIARVTVRLAFDWQTALSDRLDLRVYGWARYVGRSRLGVGPFLGEAQGNYYDSALTARVGTPRLGVTLGLTNLADAVGNRFALGTPFAIGRRQITPLRPRTVRIGVDAKF